MDPGSADGGDATLHDLVARANGGDPAAKDALFTALYTELHRLAQSHLHRGGRGVTLGATTLLHEAYLRLARQDALAFPDRRHFLGYASRAMRGLVIDYVRTRRAQKRGGELTFVEFDERAAAMPAEAPDLEELGRALDALAALDPALAELVDLRFFCGFSCAEIASIRGVSERTIQRDWAKARILLRRSLTDA
jgi:RNA polymerase sigma factor (TIGR02999 family)